MLLVGAEYVAPSSACRHLLPIGEKRLGAGLSLELSLLPSGEKVARRVG